jgi:hypothetical protein
MIDFRYHLISIIAVFLALGIGILMGSLVLGEALLDQLERDVDRLGNRNDDLLGTVEDLQTQVNLSEDFASLARANMIAGQLSGEQIVLFTYQGTEGALLDQIRSTVEEAGGSVVDTIEVTDKLALDGEAELAQLALILGSASDEPAELQTELGGLLGSEAAAAAIETPGQDPPNQGTQPGKDLEVLVRDLQEDGFLNVDGLEDGETMVPPGASFVIAAGSADDPPFAVDGYTLALANSLIVDGAPVLGLETTTSLWKFSTLLRDDDSAQDNLTTIDNAESVTGSIALVLSLEQAEDGVRGNHYGVGDGAESVIPEPAPTP